MSAFSSRSFVVAFGLALAAGSSFTLTALAPREARACGDGFDFAPRIDHRIEGVARAEKALREGRYTAAAGSVVRMFPALQKATMGHDPLIDRAFRTLALAIVRAGGALPIDREIPRELRGTWAGGSEEDRRANLEWALVTMRGLSDRQKDADDPALKSDLGEALAAAGRHDEALAVLADLAERDLLTSPEAYAALAGLRERAGDAAGKLAALRKCEAMAKVAGVCAKDAGPGQG